jgi:hypothetical protein
MAAIPHAFTEQNSRQTRTGAASYGDVSGAAIANTNFTAGKKYLLLITAQADASANSNDFGVRVIHGSTPFADSEMQFETAAAAERLVYQWLHVWTAVSGEDIKLQFAPLTSSANTIGLDQIAMMAICLSDNVTENTDWFFSEVGTDQGLSTTPSTNGASITFTPGTADHDWIVITFAQIDCTDNQNSMRSRMNRVGVSTLPEARWETGSSVAGSLFMLQRVFTLAASEHTFREESFSTGSQTRLHSKVFALNLNKFKNHAFVYTEADASLSATNYATELASIQINPAVQSDVLIGAYFGFDQQNAGRECEFRVQVDDADQPAGQSTDNYQFAHGTDAADEYPENLITMVANMTTGAKTIALDASADSTSSTPAGQQRTLWAVTMELAATGGAFTLSAESGSYALTGQASALLKASLLAANAGSYAISGTAATLKAARKLIAESGGYNLTGSDVTFVRDLLLSAESGTYQITGQDVALLRALIMAAEGGSYIITGTAVNLARAFILAAESGGYTITGQDATFIRDLVLAAETGSYQINGTQAGLLRDAKLAADAGAYALTGSDAALKLMRAIIAEPGAYAISGTAAELLRDAILAAESGTYQLTGFDAGLIRDAVIHADPGSYAIIGSEVALVYTQPGQYTLVAESGSYQISGQTAALLRHALLTADAGSYLVTGQDVGLSKGFIMIAESGAYLVTGTAAELLADRLVSAESGAYQITGQDVSLERHAVIVAESGTYIVTGEEAALLRSLVLQAEAGVYQIDGQDVLLLYSEEGVYIMTAESGVYALTGSAADLVKWIIPDYTAKTKLGGDDVKFTESKGQVVYTDSRGNVVTFTESKGQVIYTDSKGNVVTFTKAEE